MKTTGTKAATSSFATSSDGRCKVCCLSAAPPSTGSMPRYEAMTAAELACERAYIRAEVSSPQNDARVRHHMTHALADIDAIAARRR